VNLTGGAASGTLNSFDVANGLQTQAITGGTYAVGSSSGRVTFTGVGSNPPVVYLTIPTDNVSGFIVGGDTDAAFGTATSQPSATFTLAAIAHTYFFGTGEPADNTVPDSIGVVTLASSGAVTGTEQVSDQQGLRTNESVSETLTLNPDGTGNFGSGSFFITSGNSFFFLNGSDAEVFEGGR
jgi:hypothetical protein